MPILILLVVAVILKGVVNFFVQLSNEQKELSANNKETTEEVKDSTTVKNTEEVAKVADPTIKGKEENLFDSEANKKLKDEVLKNIENKNQETTSINRLKVFSVKSTFLLKLKTSLMS